MDSIIWAIVIPGEISRGSDLAVIEGGLTGWESVRVDNQIGLHAALGEWHVDGRPELRADTLLTVTRGELVTDNRLTGNAVLDADRLDGLVARLGTHETDALNVAGFRILVLEEVGDPVDIDVGVGRGVVAHVMEGGDLVALLHARTDMWETVLVNELAHLLAYHVAGGETEQLGHFALGLAASRVTFGEGVHFSLVDCTVTEPALVG
jgi:hypothetical protein